MKPIDYTTFTQINICIGTIVQVSEFPKAQKPAYKVWVDFGEKRGVLQTSAQITHYYTPDILIGKQVLGCINIGERNIAGFISQFLLLGLSDESGGVHLLSPDQKVANGNRLH